MKTIEPIMLVDDDYVDVKTVERAIHDAKIGNPLIVCNNGEEAFEYLKNAEELPRLILLDINMPIMSGLELLAHLKSDERLKDIPVLVLTTSEHEKDKKSAYERQAAAYMVKPWNYRDLVEMFESIKNYWGLAEETLDND